MHQCTPHTYTDTEALSSGGAHTTRMRSVVTSYTCGGAGCLGGSFRDLMTRELTDQELHCPPVQQRTRRKKERPSGRLRSSYMDSVMLLEMVRQS